MPDHRAEQILDQVKALLLAGPTDASAKVTRARNEPPLEADYSGTGQALDIVMGPDSPPEEGFTNLSFIDSVLSLYVDQYIKQATQETIPEEAHNALRLQVHKALMFSDFKLSLSFVTVIRPAGADQPEYIGDREFIVNRMRTRWLVQYRSSITDPST